MERWSDGAMEQWETRAATAGMSITPTLQDSIAPFCILIVFPAGSRGRVGNWIRFAAGSQARAGTS